MVASWQRGSHLIGTAKAMKIYRGPGGGVVGEYDGGGGGGGESDGGKGVVGEYDGGCGGFGGGICYHLSYFGDLTTFPRKSFCSGKCQVPLHTQEFCKCQSLIFHKVGNFSILRNISLSLF